MGLREQRCYFLDCEYEGPLTLLIHADGLAWELCRTHARIVDKNGIGFVRNNGEKRVVSGRIGEKYAK